MPGASYILWPLPSHFLSSKASIFGSFISRIIIYVVAAEGALVGALTGFFMGLTDESGPIRGAGVGALSGAIFVSEAFKSSLDTWLLNESNVWEHMIGIIGNVLNKRLAREMSVHALQRAIQSQMSVAESAFTASISIIDPCYPRGMTRESVEKIPKICITSQNNINGTRDRIGCVVCLQDFEVGEVARCLPNCQHMFHMACIDGWIMRHRSCPLCRRSVN